MTREEDVHEIDLTELFEIIWNRKLFILLSVTLSAVFSVIYASSQVNYFKSDALLKIVDNLGTSTQSPPGGYASFLGLNMSVDSNLHEELVATIKSKDFFKIILLHGEYILPNISAAIDFDMDKRSIIYNENIYDPKKNIWIDNRKPSFLNAYRKYANMLNVGIEKDSGFLDISVEHVSPIFAKELIDIIVIESNILFKNNQLEESSRSLIFLNNKLETESLVNIRDAAQQLIVKNLENK